MLLPSSHAAKAKAVTAGCRAENLLLPWHSRRVKDVRGRGAPGAVQPASSCGWDAGVVREGALVTAAGALVVPQHLLQVLPLCGVSAGGWGRVPCGSGTGAAGVG